MFYVLTSCITEACELSPWFLERFSKIHQASVFFSAFSELGHWWLDRGNASRVLQLTRDGLGFSRCSAGQAKT